MKRMSMLSLLLLLNVVRPVAAQTPSPVVPDFTFYKLDGTPFSSKNLLVNKPSVFSFFDVTCTHCQTTMKILSSHYPDLKNAGVYLVTLDRKDAVLKFMNTYGRNFLNKDHVFVLLDVQQEFIPKFRPLKYPSVFLYDKTRKLVVYEKDDKKIGGLVKRLKALQ